MPGLSAGARGKESLFVGGVKLVKRKLGCWHSVCLARQIHKNNSSPGNRLVELENVSDTDQL